MEREILEPVDIADSEGRLRREAVGWARRQLHRCHLSSRFSRVGRWNYWCITNRQCALTLLIGDVGLCGFTLVSFVDYEAGDPIDRLWVRPFGLGAPMPDSTTGDIDIDAWRLRLSMRMRGEDMIVRGDVLTLFGTRMNIDLVVHRPARHETINVLVPFDDTQFHFTSKQQALPAEGSVRVGSREYRFGPTNQGFACLDFGRGRWPPKIDWNWAFASSSEQGDHTLGLNFGGRWTDGTGVTENGIVVDGRVHKISDPIDFTYDTSSMMKPWHIRTRTSDRVDVRFDPICERTVKIPLGVASARLHQHVGTFRGTVIDDHGTRIAITDMLGVAEWFRGHWGALG